MVLYRRPIVIKCGTECLYAAKITSETEWPYAPQNAFDRTAVQIVKVQKSGVPVVIVSSGAKKEGKQRFLPTLSTSVRLSGKEYAGIGAPHLYKRWSDAFEKYKKSVAQILVTDANLSTDGEQRSVAVTIASYQKNGVIPIVNENDVVADAERCIGDNDRLARMIAELICADAVLFLTHSGGVYEESPTHNPYARQYKEIDARTALTDSRLSDGMYRKLYEAVQCFAMGMRVGIAGIDDDTIQRFAAGEPVGTMIGNVVQFY